MERRQPLKRKTPLRSKRPTKRRSTGPRCTWSNRCKRRVSVVLTNDERYCNTHALVRADQAVGAFVKARDGRCLACGTKNDLEWAHIISRGARYIRWDPENSVALCRGCHFRFTRAPARWAVWVEEFEAGLLSKLAQREAAGQRSGESIDVADVIVRFRTTCL